MLLLNELCYVLLCYGMVCFGYGYRIYSKVQYGQMGTQVCSTCETHPSASATIITREFQGEVKQYIADIRNKYKADIESNSREHVLPNGNLYRGHLSAGKKEGYGQYYAGPDSAYFGLFSENLPHGEGLMISKSTNYIKSTFVNGVPHGQSHEKVNCNYFHGHLVAGVKTKGVMTTDQYKYEGTFNQDSKFEGYGVLQFQNGDRYTGDFKAGLYHGDGSYVSRDGEIYRGEWKMGKYDGVGVFKWSQNRWYDGEYREGVRHGWGTMVDGENGTWQGLWMNGELQNGKQNHQSGINTKKEQKIKDLKLKIGAPERTNKLTESTSHNDLAGYTIELF